MVERAAPIRRGSFKAGRVAARCALAKLGYPPGPLLAHPAGDPVWPAGVVGSISHAAGWALAVAAHRKDLYGLGLDLEGAEPLEEDLIDLVCRREERGIDPDLAAQGIDAAKLRFVAKEAWYKAVFPTWRRFIEFDEALVGINAGDGHFRASFVGKGPGPPAGRGDFILTAGLLCAVCALPPGLPP